MHERHDVKKIACGRGLPPVQDLEAMPRLVWPQEASEALLGLQTHEDVLKMLLNVTIY